MYLVLFSEVAQLLSLNFGRDDVTDTTESGRHYLVILESEGVGLSTSSWPSDKIKIVDTSVEIAIAVADLQVCTYVCADSMRRMVYEIVFSAIVKSPVSTTTTIHPS